MKPPCRELSSPERETKDREQPDPTELMARWHHPALTWPTWPT